MKYTKATKTTKRWNGLNETTQAIRVELYGDSIGKGVIYNPERGRYTLARDRVTNLLQAAFPLDIRNHSVMGATTTDGLNTIVTEPGAPGSVAVIEFGGNDCDLHWDEVAKAPDAVHEARVPLPLFRAQLKRIVSRARELGMRPLLITPPPLDAKRYFAWVSKGLNAKAILRYLGDVHYIYRWQEGYAAAVQAIARELRCPLLDFRSALLSVRNLKDLLCIDGIHPNEDGHRALADIACDQIQVLRTQCAAQ